MAELRSDFNRWYSAARSRAVCASDSGLVSIATFGERAFNAGIEGEGRSSGGMTDTSSCHAASWRPVSGIRRDSEKYGFAQYGSAQYGFAQENSLARRRLPALRVSSW